MGSSSSPERIGGRYAVQAEIGRGGMARVYRVVDTASGREVALKQLEPAGSDRAVRDQVAAFEREYHTLVQLAHPRIIEVYDFGADEGGRYYTMELLDGGDLREHAPLDWREACALAHDVCSSLALLHSRRLVHRDISPRNVRRTLSGSAKLIDFGAMVPMGAGGQVVGTPPFVPPEVLSRSTLDARTDLFSLGATLYYALTARFAYPARDLSKLHAAWARRPAPPSSLVPNVPAALDALVMSLISIDPAARPRTAFEVMQRLAAIAGLERVDTGDVSQAYLSTPLMVGRDEQLAALRRRIEHALQGDGSGVLIKGPGGVGRTRMLDACALDAKIGGALVLRVNPGELGGEVLAAGASLAGQLVEALPEAALLTARTLQAEATLFAAAEPRPKLKTLAGHTGERAAIQSAISRLLLQIAAAYPLAILVDDLHEADEASLALLASLVLASPGRRLILVATAESGAPVQAAGAFAVFLRDCTAIELAPLTRDETESLLDSIFGDVANLALLSERLYPAAAGNPRETLELLQTLVARGTVRYEGGQWLLPGVLAAAELPSSAAETCRERVAELSPLARRLAEVHALASHSSFSRNDYALAARGVPAGQVDAAVTELVSRHVLAGDGRTYVLSRSAWAVALSADLDEAALVARHRTLADMYAEDPAFVVEHGFHLLSGGCEEQGVDLVVRLLRENSSQAEGIMVLTRMSAAGVALILDRAVTSAEKLGRRPRDIQDLRRGLFAISILTDEAHYYRAAPDHFAQLARDSGLAFYRESGGSENPSERLMRALTHASERHNAAQEDDRVWDPETAIKGLAYYVVISIAIGSRAQDYALIASLPSVLEPFAPLSPLLHAIWQNAIATRETICDNRHEFALRRWAEVDAMLAKVAIADMVYVARLRGAIAYGIALAEARLGMSSAEEHVRVLDDDPLQRASAMSLRRIVRLHKGDMAGAERFRKQAEALALQASQRQMFTSTLTAELVAHALASDLTGIREAIQAIEPLAARFPGWQGFRHLADGYFEQARGRFEVALQAFERGLALSEPAAGDARRCTGAWLRLEGAYIETLVALGRAQSASARGLRALERCEELEIGVCSFVVRRALALAEAKLGDHAGASARLTGVIHELEAFGIRGLELGATYEAQARIAIWAADTESAERYGRLTAAEYRYGQDSPLGARYERLMDEARRSGVSALPELAEMQTAFTTASFRGMPTTTSLVRARLDGADSLRERAERALQLLCEARAARSGHLYLNTEQGFELVATHGEAEPDPALQDFVTRYVTEQLETDTQATVIETEGMVYTSCWRDLRGVAHHPALLMAEVDGRIVCAGAAVLEAGSRSITAEAGQQLLDALGDYLLRAGDARSAALD